MHPARTSEDNSNQGLVALASRYAVCGLGESALPWPAMCRRTRDISAREWKGTGGLAAGTASETPAAAIGELDRRSQY